MMECMGPSLRTMAFNDNQQTVRGGWLTRFNPIIPTDWCSGCAHPPAGYCKVKVRLHSHCFDVLHVGLDITARCPKISHFLLISSPRNSILQLHFNSIQHGFQGLRPDHRLQRWRTRLGHGDRFPWPRLPSIRDLSQLDYDVET